MTRVICGDMCDMTIYDASRQAITLPAYKLIDYSTSGTRLAIGLAQDELLNALLSSGVGEAAFAAARQWIALVETIINHGEDVPGLGPVWTGIWGPNAAGGWLYDVDVRKWIRGGDAALRDSVDGLWSAIAGEIAAGECDLDEPGGGFRADRIARLAHMLVLLDRCTGGQW